MTNKQNRRDFLKTSTVAAAGAALGTLAFAPSNVHAAGSDTIKVGVVGCGGRGTGAAENVLHSAPNVEIVAIGDVFKFRVDGLRNHLNRFAGRDEKTKSLGNKVTLPDDQCFVGLDAYEKVINSGANYIILTTPPGFRPPCLQAAIAAGKNIFTEKPVAVDGPGIRKVLAAYETSKEKGLHIAAGTQRRHQAPYLETLKRIHDGAIGDIVALRAYWNQGNIWFRKRDELASNNVQDSDLAYQLHNWYHFVWTCGDHICEQHVHNLDVCNWAMNTHPTRAVGMGGRQSLPPNNPQVNGNIFDHFAIDYEYPKGVRMMSMCRQIDHCEGSISEALVGTKGTCITNDPAKIFTINGKAIMSREEARAATDAYVQEHTDLIESIRKNQSLNELKNVAESTLTAIMGRMSTYTGKPVTWQQALNSKEDTMPEKLAWDMKLETPQAATPGKTPLV
jgi:predicted dehydrogenase